jgi:hypothetical protein
MEVQQCIINYVAHVNLGNIEIYLYISSVNL